MVVGCELSEVEYADLATRWIDRNWAQLAGLRHVHHLDGKSLIGGSRGDYEGIALPYYVPGNGHHPVAYRLRRKNPEIDLRTGKPRRKYLSAESDRNKIYFPPLTKQEDLKDTELPILIVEGELKAIAMRRLASEGSARPRFVVIAVSGVWNWRGTVGNETNANGVRVQVKGPIPDLDLIVWVGRNVIIAFDSDAATKNDVRKARHFLSLELRSRGANVGYLEWNGEQGKGPDDWVATVGPYEVLAAIGKVEFNNATGWQSKLLCTDTGKAKALVENARIALENVPDFAGLALDEFSGRIVRPPGAPWPATAGSQWSDYDSIEFSAWLQRNHIDMGKDSAYDAVQMVAARNRFHPVRNYLEGLVWDGMPRLDRWLVDYVGVASSNYTLAAGRCWLISAVARIMQPGCKADVALLLIGPEGKRKSTVCRILGEPWFSDNIPDLGEKDAQMHMAGHWILEMGELAALNKAALTTVKSWMSRSEDVYRPAYGRSIIHQPRQCVFIATSNEGEPLKDTTGNRRFLPVEVGDIDTDALARDKDQLWAEAVELYNAGASWWFTDATLVEDAKREQANRVELHVWYEPIEKWCVDREFVTVSEILDNCIRKDQQTRNQADKINVVRCLQAMGWKLTKRRINGRGSKVYLNPEFLES